MRSLSSRRGSRGLLLVTVVVLGLLGVVQAQVDTYNKCKCSASSPCYFGGVYQTAWCYVDESSCAAGIPFREQSTGRGWDLCPATVTSQPFSGATVSATSLSTSETSTPTSLSTAQKSSSGLSTTAIAGIAVGIVGGVALIAFAGFIVFKRRGGADRERAPDTPTPDALSTSNLHAGTTTPYPPPTSTPAPPRPETAWSHSSAVTAFGAFGANQAAVKAVRQSKLSQMWSRSNSEKSSSAASETPLVQSAAGVAAAAAIPDMSTASSSAHLVDTPASPYVPNTGTAIPPSSVWAPQSTATSLAPSSYLPPAPAPSITSSLPPSSILAAPPPPGAGTTGAAPALVAMEPYAPQYPGDLMLRTGDRVEVEHRFGDGWARGRNVETGEVGVFPEGFVGVV
ncbi:hypothetical protein M427DRAFT_138728 [Gonapodya prolifera JEL478]|uniref:SH3 domain-containing protein n=1 Tax=Gonapodya prolifera (strain JEL478) TaxID=1344416 RepID=A0A139A2F3_GONPJ|nr:hypothetical protein M427DRAFT_138728 [Gonapodya prolifera JEL478]|eukprot:KXS10942.1 hypothetical protein M427DRAFT_138728 [Gonapodya prolifera JEL478]